MSNSNYYSGKSYLRNTTIRKFFLDIASLPRIDYSKGDYIIVPPQCEHRIDLFSYMQYGSSRMWWLIALANDNIIRDPIWDFKSGMNVFVPRDNALLEKLSGVN